jgi:hypothetical protein
VAAKRLKPPSPKNFRVQKSAGKFSPLLDFLGSRRHPPVYLPKNQTINAEYYPHLLVQMKDILKEKRQEIEYHQGFFFLTRQ